jgi:hypothetical protein
LRHAKRDAAADANQTAFGVGQPRGSRRRKHQLHRTAITMPTTAADAEETICNIPLAISQLISTHPRERLFVHPLLWNARHLALLDCEFVNDGIIARLPQQPDAIVLPTPAAPPATLPSPPDKVPADNSHAAELKRYFAFRDSDANAPCMFASGQTSIVKRNALSRLLRGLGLECHQ